MTDRNPALDQAVDKLKQAAALVKEVAAGSTDDEITLLSEEVADVLMRAAAVAAERSTTPTS